MQKSDIAIVEANVGGDLFKKEEPDADLPIPIESQEKQADDTSNDTPTS